MALGTILLTIMVLVLIGAFPAWPHNRSWELRPKRRVDAGIDHSARAGVDGADCTLTPALLPMRQGQRLIPIAGGFLIHLEK